MPNKALNSFAHSKQMNASIWISGEKTVNYSATVSISKFPFHCPSTASTNNIIFVMVLDHSVLCGSVNCAEPGVCDELNTF